MKYLTILTINILLSLELSAKTCSSSDEIANEVSKSIRFFRDREFNFPPSVRRTLYVKGGLHPVDDHLKLFHRVFFEGIFRLKSSVIKPEDIDVADTLQSVSLRYDQKHLLHACIDMKEDGTYKIDLHFLRAYRLDRFRDAPWTEKILRVIGWLPSTLTGWPKPSAKISPTSIQITPLGGVLEILDRLQLKSFIPRSIEKNLIDTPSKVIQDLLRLIAGYGVQRIEITRDKIKFTLGLSLLGQNTGKSSYEVLLKN